MRRGCGSFVFNFTRDVTIRVLRTLNGQGQMLSALRLGKESGVGSTNYSHRGVVFKVLGVGQQEYSLWKS